MDPEELTGEDTRLNKYVRNKDAEMIQGDIRDFEVVNKAVSGVDVVFHLAACIGRQRSIDNPQLDSDVNLIGTISAAVFGELETLTVDEEHPQNANTPYGVSKLAAEKMILAYSGIYRELTGCCLRYFNVYGVNQRFDLYGNVIPIFAKRIYSEESIIIYGDGLQTRDFINVRDVAQANYLGAINGRKSDVYNLGSGSCITIQQLAEMMIKISGKNTKIIYAPERVADVKHCTANIKKISECMNFQPETEIEKGLEEYMRWYKDHCV